MNRGEIWWSEDPQLGRRPACILTRQATIPVLQHVLIAPATRTVRGIPTEVALSRADGMPADCVLTFDNLRTIPKTFLTERITRLPAPRMHELCEALRVATGC